MRILYSKVRSNAASHAGHGFYRGFLSAGSFNHELMPAAIVLYCPIHWDSMTDPLLSIPFLDLKAQYHSIKPEIDAAIAGVLESSQFVLGAAVTDFEREFGKFCDATECVAVNSGTSALHLALLAAGV